jgi:transcriptional regulator with XRE-family HTH domain
MNGRPPPAATPARPGAVIRSLRTQRGWTLAEVSRRTGFPISTLSKIENDRVSLSYDKLTRISSGMEIDISLLFGAHRGAEDAATTGGRRSVTRCGEGTSIDSKNYHHLYPAADLLNKSLIPIVVEHRARSLEEFGELVRHSGEEYLYVLEGELEVHTSLYAPVRLKAGDSIYIDSQMGHAYLAVGSGACRSVCVCSASEGQLIAAVGGHGAVAAAVTAAARTTARKPRRRRPGA